MFLLWNTLFNQRLVINRTIDNISSVLKCFISSLSLTSIIRIIQIPETPSPILYSHFRPNHRLRRHHYRHLWGNRRLHHLIICRPSHHPRYCCRSQYIIYSPRLLLYQHTSSILAHIDKISKAKENIEEVIRWLKQKWHGCNCSHNPHLFRTNNLTRNERE